MNASRIMFSGFGLCSSLGGYKDACAAYRAGLNRFSAHTEVKTMFPGNEEPVPLTVAPAACNIFAYQGLARTVKLFQFAYADLLDNIEQDLPQENIALLFTMPDPLEREQNLDIDEELAREQRLQEYVDALKAPLFTICPGLKDIPMQCSFGERAAFARVLKKAITLLNTGKVDHCLVMVADSLLDDHMLQVQLQENRLKTEDNPVGYIPGEGAAAILLSSEALSKSDKNREPLAANINVSIDNRTVDEQIPEIEDEAQLDKLIDQQQRASWHGEKLVNVLTDLLGDSYEQQSFPQHISDVNGEEHRAIELGNTLVKLRLQCPSASFSEVQVPALGFGEVGAVMGPLALMTVAAAVQRGYATQREFVITLSDESGKRAAIKLLFSAPKEEE